MARLRHPNIVRILARVIPHGASQDPNQPGFIAMERLGAPLREYDILRSAILPCDSVHMHHDFNTPTSSAARRHETLLDGRRSCPACFGARACLCCCRQDLSNGADFSAALSAAVLSWKRSWMDVAFLDECGLWLQAWLQGRGGEGMPGGFCLTIYAQPTAGASGSTRRERAFHPGLQGLAGG